MRLQPILLIVALLAAAPADAHDVDLPMAGTFLEIRTGTGLFDQWVEFESLDPTIDVGHDPSGTTTWVVMRGYGPNGGTSGRIVLDASKWAPLPDRPGYEYLDLQGNRSGVKQVVIEPGRLALTAAGRFWSWQIGGPQDSVWIQFALEDETRCASFGGTITRNEAGFFEASDALPPAACPQAICSNGRVELGEACDDGNLVEDDGCTTSCEIGTCVGESYESTFDAIQELVFTQQGCTIGLCHGVGLPQAGLDLRPGLSYPQLLEIPATGSGYDRIEPGDPRESALWLKLEKAADPTINIPGAAMPSGLSPIPDPLREAVRMWIQAGAPETGTVAGTESLLAGCFPEPGPIAITPLLPPAAGEGVQLEMPEYTLPAESESEVCFATYYDWTDQVPAQFVDESGDSFYVAQGERRHDPHSHHLVAAHSGLGAEFVHHASLGSWSCAGGETEGALCNPLELGACDSGHCRSALTTRVACIGFGPPGGAVSIGMGDGISGVASDLPGFFKRIPIRGIVYWNSHAFNLTSTAHTMHARQNLYFAAIRRQEVNPLIDITRISIAAGQPPFTIDSYCHDHTLPQDTAILTLSSHTHQRGERFWVLDPDGNEIYQSLVYSDPPTEVFDPPLLFDSSDPAERTLRFCATYNNGVGPGGAPDPETVRLSSFSPGNATRCSPTACTDGLVGAACNGSFDEASCDSVPGAGDGVCDACPITFGVSTEDEMFVLLGTRFLSVPEPSAGACGVVALLALFGLHRAAGRRPQPL